MAESAGGTLVPRMRDSTEPLAGTIASIIITILTATILASLITQRILGIKEWRALPPVAWMGRNDGFALPRGSPQERRLTLATRGGSTVVFAIFFDSWLFVFVTGILKFGLGLGTSYGICQGAILLCLVCYVTTKILIYIFLVEKAYIIRQSSVPKPRLKSKLYIFNFFGMLGIYVIVSVLNFVFRITRLHEGACIIGMQRVAMIPLITFDLIVNVYLTILFLLPLRNLHKIRHIQRNPANERLRTVAFRTFIGAVATTISSIVNLSVLMALDGEPGWVCLMCCNVDIAFSAIMVHWVTSKDKTVPFSPSATSAYAKGGVTSAYQVDSEHGGPGGDPSARVGSGGSGINPMAVINGQCLHECRPGTGCYSTGSAMSTPTSPTFGASITGQRQSNNNNNNNNNNNSSKKAAEAIAMYHYHHHRHMNGGSSNRYPFTKAASVTGGTLENSRAPDSSRYSEFRKYGGSSLFPEGVDWIYDDGDGEKGTGAGSSDEDCEYELVLRKKRRPRTPPILPAELDPVLTLSRKGSRKWSVAKETTLVVESKAVGEEDGVARQGGGPGSRAVFGTRTVCLGGEHHHDGKDGCQGEGGAACTGSAGGSSSVGSRLKKVAKLHSRNTSGVTSEDGEGGGKKAVSWMESPTTDSFVEGVGDEDGMWDGTQGNRAARVEPEGRPASLNSRDSYLDLRIEDFGLSQEQEH
ncbi:hypothetical protein Micbo1qcDRAFT_215832 [Microdochium bolleyi]|uniref:Uncharacterized protein n=1 Tax=Microdochium bolleyi TaxID=196109 RepID=A0A136IR97_9PEZI|nr:hypothetical protein Micbo1qcDRAFT_215832 [Microdochium bolleyi]